MHMLNFDMRALKLIKFMWETWIYTVYGNGMYSSYLAYTSKIQCSLLVHYFNDKSPMFSHFIFSKLTMKFYGIWYNVLQWELVSYGASALLLSILEIIFLVYCRRWTWKWHVLHGHSSLWIYKENSRLGFQEHADKLSFRRL